MTTEKTKMLIIGSGPAGYTAGIYAARAGLNPVIISGHQTGGQLTSSTDVENFPGFPKPILGTELMERMKEQVENFAVKVVIDSVKKTDFSSHPFKIETENGKTYAADSVVIATGASAKKAGIPGEEKFWGCGVSGCATCDGYFCRGNPVAVIGGGNAAAIEALHLANLASSVTLIHRRDSLRAEKIMADRVVANPKITVEWNSVVDEIIGIDKPLGITHLKIKNLKTGKTKRLDVGTVFVAIGHRPNTGIFHGQINLDENGYVITKSGTTETSVKGVFAAGDVANPKYKQAIMAAGKGAEAALDAVKFLEDLKGREE